MKRSKIQGLRDCSGAQAHLAQHFLLSGSRNLSAKELSKEANGAPAGWKRRRALFCEVPVLHTAPAGAPSVPEPSRPRRRRRRVGGLPTNLGTPSLLSVATLLGHSRSRWTAVLWDRPPGRKGSRKFQERRDSGLHPPPQGRSAQPASARGPSHRCPGNRRAVATAGRAGLPAGDAAGLGYKRRRLRLAGAELSRTLGKRWRSGGFPSCAQNRARCSSSTPVSARSSVSSSPHASPRPEAGAIGSLGSWMEPLSGGGWLRVGGRVIGFRTHGSFLGVCVGGCPGKPSPARSEWVRELSQSFSYFPSGLKAPRTCSLRLFSMCALVPRVPSRVGDPARRRRESFG